MQKFKRPPEATASVSKKEIVNDITMHWHELGEGMPLVLIHGIPTSPALWRYVMPLIPQARCMAFEMVGYGDSIAQGKDRDISVRHQADYVASWLKKLNIKQAVFAGHDLGGGVVQNIAVRYPELCKGIFLTNAICYDSWPIPSVKAMDTLSPLVRKLPDIMGKQILRTLMMRGHDDSNKADEALEVHWRPYAHSEGAKALTRQIHSLNVEDTLFLEEELPKIDVPARLAWGAADPFQKVEYGERLARDLGAPMRWIEGGKHFTPEDHPTIIAEEINQLLDDVQQKIGEREAIHAMEV